MNVSATSHDVALGECRHCVGEPDCGGDDGHICT